MCRKRHSGASGMVDGGVSGMPALPAPLAHVSFGFNRL
jgi:hypothetical protein